MSFEGAIDRLYEIRKDDQRMIAVILVANKTDLVRSRVVQEEGQCSLKTFVVSWKYIMRNIQNDYYDLLLLFLFSCYS